MIVAWFSSCMYVMCWILVLNSSYNDKYEVDSDLVFEVITNSFNPKITVAIDTEVILDSNSFVILYCRLVDLLFDIYVYSLR